jgi:hypothetical protein
MFSPEFKILLLSLRLDDPASAADEADTLIRCPEVKWQRLYSLADSHAVKPQLAKLLRTLSEAVIPRDVTDGIEAACKLNLTDQLSHVNEFIKVRNKLDEAGIVIVPFKGFWIAENYYGNLADREANDIDVFIDYRDLDGISVLMQEIGYLPGAPYLERPDKKDCEYNFGRYENRRCIVHFEFHWRIAPSGFGLDITLPDLRGQIKTGYLQGMEIPVFSPAATLLLTVMHHGGKDAYRYLKQVYDIAMIVEKSKELDEEWLIREAKKAHCLRLLFVALKLARLVTGLTVPLSVRAEVESRNITRLARNRLRYLEISPPERKQFMITVSDWLFRIRSRDGFVVKAGLFFRFVRKELVPWLTPESLHPYFIRKYFIPDYAEKG